MVTAQVEDVVKWEEGFRTHGDLFRNSYTVTTPVGIAISEGNEIAVCFEPADLDKALGGHPLPSDGRSHGYRRCQSGDREGLRIRQGIPGLGALRRETTLTPDPRWCYAMLPPPM